MRLSLSLSLGAVALCSASPLLIFDSAAQTQLSPAQTLPAPVAHLSLSQLELLVDQHEDPVALMALLGERSALSPRPASYLARGLTGLDLYLQIHLKPRRKRNPDFLKFTARKRNG